MPGAEVQGFFVVPVKEIWVSLVIPCDPSMRQDLARFVERLPSAWLVICCESSSDFEDFWI
jgi:hypothetical protein